MLVERYQELVFRTAYLILGNAAEAEDAAQEAFVKAYHALPRFRSGAPFRPWLLQITANEARNRSRSDQRRTNLALRAGATAIVHEEESPEAAVLAAESRRQLVAALAQLRDDERLAIGYRYFLDLSEADMAALLKCARGTVKSRLSRALARLRRILLADGGAAIRPGDS